MSEMGKLKKWHKSTMTSRSKIRKDKKLIKSLQAQVAEYDEREKVDEEVIQALQEKVAALEAPVLPDDVKAIWCYLRANGQTDAADMLERLQAQVAALEKQLRIARCCENVDCDRDDCPLKQEEAAE